VVFESKSLFLLTPKYAGNPKMGTRRIAKESFKAGLEKSGYTTKVSDEIWKWYTARSKLNGYNKTAKQDSSPTGLFG